jgi:hypothetical protein
MRRHCRRWYQVKHNNVTVLARYVRRCCYRWSTGSRDGTPWQGLEQDAVVTGVRLAVVGLVCQRLDEHSLKVSAGAALEAQDGVEQHVDGLVTGFSDSAW